MANSVGKGRNDLTVDILKAADKVLKERTPKSVKTLARQIKSSFARLRELMQGYSQCIEEVDPQLKENPSLVEVLGEFEKTWEKGKQFLVNEQLLEVFSSLSLEIEKLEKANDGIKEKMKSMDVEVFFMVPCLAVLKSLEDNSTGIYALCGTHNCLWRAEDFLRLRTTYEAEKKRHSVHSILETAIVKGEEDGRVVRLLNEVKQMALILQRSSPSDWNTFMQLIINH